MKSNQQTFCSNSPIFFHHFSLLTSYALFLNPMNLLSAPIWTWGYLFWHHFLEEHIFSSCQQSVANSSPATNETSWALPPFILAPDLILWNAWVCIHICSGFMYASFSRNAQWRQFTSDIYYLCFWPSFYSLSIMNLEPGEWGFW